MPGSISVSFLASGLHNTIAATSPVAISVPTLVIELVLFLIMVYAMQALVFNPIREKWAERDRLIQEGLNASNLGREEAEQARAEVQRILFEARQSAQHEIDQATAAGNKVREAMLAEATTQFRQQLDQARQELATQREQAAATLRDRIIDLALQAASTVTGQSYNQPQVRELAAAVVRQEGLA